jgi:hypothetical protein
MRLFVKEVETAYTEKHHHYINGPEKDRSI